MKSATVGLPKGIAKRGNIFWLRYMEQGVMRQISLQTSDPTEAVERSIRVRNAPELAPKEGLAADIERFIASKWLQGRFTSEETVKWSRRSLTHLVNYFPSKSAKMISRGDMERFAGNLLENQSEPGAMSYLRAIKSFFSWTVKEKIRFENPCSGLVREPKEPARKKFASKAQRDALLRACEEQRTSQDVIIREGYHEALHFALFCSLHAGMRYNEIIQARPDWFHLDATPAYVEIQNTETFKTKNRRSRTVPLSTPFLEFLKIYGLREPFMLMAEKKQKKHVYRYDFRAPWKAHVTKNGVPWLTPHNARRTFGSLLAQSGEDPYKISKWMGHSIVVFEKHYGHLRPGDSGIDKML